MTSMLYYYFFVCLLCVVAPASSYTCEDKVPDCKLYGKHVCDDPQYFRWVYDYCPKYCEMCRYLDQDRITLPPSTKPACVDAYPYCKMYIPVCSSENYSQWIHDNCRKTCGICHSPTTHATPHRFVE